MATDGSAEAAMRTRELSADREHHDDERPHGRESSEGKFYTGSTDELS
jgi:hypothetical protein